MIVNDGGTLKKGKIFVNNAGQVIDQHDFKAVHFNIGGVIKTLPKVNNLLMNIDKNYCVLGDNVNRFFLCDSKGTFREGTTNTNAWAVNGNENGSNWGLKNNNGSYFHVGKQKFNINYTFPGTNVITVNCRFMATDLNNWRAPWSLTYGLRIEKTTNNELTIYNDSGWADGSVTVTPQSINFGTFTNVTLTCQNSGGEVLCKMFVGNQSTQASFNGTISSIDTIYFNKKSPTQDYSFANLKFSHFRIWNTILTDDEILKVHDLNG